MIGITAIGRVTVVTLGMNRERALRIREADAAFQRHPPEGDRRQ